MNVLRCKLVIAGRQGVGVSARQRPAAAVGAAQAVRHPPSPLQRLPRTLACRFCTLVVNRPWAARGRGEARSDKGGRGAAAAAAAAVASGASAASPAAAAATPWCATPLQHPAAVCGTHHHQPDAAHSTASRGMRPTGPAPSRPTARRQPAWPARRDTGRAGRRVGAEGGSTATHAAPSHASAPLPVPRHVRCRPSPLQRRLALTGPTNLRLATATSRSSGCGRPWGCSAATAEMKRSGWTGSGGGAVLVTARRCLSGDGGGGRLGREDACCPSAARRAPGPCTPPGARQAPRVRAGTARPAHLALHAARAARDAEVRTSRPPRRARPCSATAPAASSGCAAAYL